MHALHATCWIQISKLVSQKSQSGKGTRVGNCSIESLLKGEDHSKNRVFFCITNKKFTLSWVTHRCFSFWNGCDPNEKEVKSSTLEATILKGSCRPGHISVTSFRSRMCLFFWALVRLLLKPERASDSTDDNNQGEWNDWLENALWEMCNHADAKRMCLLPSRSPRWKVHFTVQLQWTQLAEEEVYFNCKMLSELNWLLKQIPSIVLLIWFVSIFILPVVQCGGSSSWHHRNWQVFKGVFKSGECFPPHKSLFLLIKFGYILLVLIRVCLGFFTRIYYVDSCEIRSNFTCKMWSEIDVFDVKCDFLCEL